MKSSKLVLVLLTFGLISFAQNDRGTITGTITDPAGAVIAGAPVEAKNAGNRVCLFRRRIGYRQLHHSRKSRPALIKSP